MVKINNFGLLLLITHLLLKNFSIASLQGLNFIFNYLKPYSVITFIDISAGKSNSKDFLLQQLAKCFSIITVDLTSMKEFNNNQSLNMPIFQNPRQSAIVTILMQKNSSENVDIENVNYILNTLIKISPIPTRPKCLLIYPDEQDWSHREVKKILNYAWSLKFLDFSAIVMKNATHIFFMNYNPFIQIYNAKYLTDPNDIFPDKTKNVNKYPLIIPGYHLKPYFYLEKINNKSVEIKGWHRVFLNSFIKKMNFSPRFTEEKQRKLLENYEDMITKIEQDNLQVTPMAFLMDKFLHDRNVMKGIFSRQAYAALLVPILEKSKLNFSFEIFLCILSLPFIVGIYRLSSIILKFEPQYWSLDNILQLIIGMPISTPKKTIEKCIFLYIAVLSTVFTNVFLSKLSEMNIVYGEQNFDSLEDIINSNMKIYSLYPVTHQDSTEVKILFSKSEKGTDNKSCVKKLIETRQVICIMNNYVAKYYAESNLDENRMPIMKITRLKFHEEYIAYGYEKASPFAEKFNKYVELIIESGIPVEKGLKLDIQVQKSEKTTVREDILLQQLIVILFFGFLSSIVVFLGEFFI